MKPLTFAGGIFALAAVGSALAQTGAALSGKWIVTWTDNTSNTISLTYTNARLSGTYANDDKAACSVTGNFRAADRHLSLQIVRPKWTSACRASPDGREIAGSFQTYIEVAGRFTMVKR